MNQERSWYSISTRFADPADRSRLLKLLKERLRTRYPQYTLIVERGELTIEVAQDTWTDADRVFLDELYEQDIIGHWRVWEEEA